MEPRKRSLELALHRQRQVRMAYTRSLDQALHKHRLVWAPPWPCAASWRQQARAPCALSLSYHAGTGTSTVCSMLRSWTTCSTVRCWMWSSVWVSASTRRDLLAPWCVADATAHRMANSSWRHQVLRRLSRLRSSRAMRARARLRVKPSETMASHLGSARRATR